MNELETAHYLIKKMSKHTTSVTKQMTFINAKECALICASEVQAQYELEHDPKHWVFWNNVVLYIAHMEIDKL